MFWRFGGYSSISTIDSLLDKPDVSLEELLDESELIQELKQLNTKLIEYLREDDVLKKLMDYVVAPSLVDDNDDDDDQDTPSNDDAKNDVSATEKKSDPLKSLLDPEDLERAEKERLKRAYIACEVLSSEVWSILDSIMANPEYLRGFWGFIRRPAPLDPIQASYFTKVNETLLDKKTGEMLELLKSMDDIVPAILQHVDNPMVMDLLLKLISLERAEGGQGIVDVSAYSPDESVLSNMHYPVAQIAGSNTEVALFPFA
jgi:SIT4-associating protein SAP185/190